MNRIAQGSFESSFGSSSLLKLTILTLKEWVIAFATQFLHSDTCKSYAVKNGFDWFILLITFDNSYSALLTSCIKFGNVDLLSGGSRA